MTAPTFIEHVLVPAPFGPTSCRGCAFLNRTPSGWRVCTDPDMTRANVACFGKVFAVVPAGFSDGEVSE